VTEVTGFIEGMIRRTDKVVTTIVEYVWGFDFEYELQAVQGMATEGAIALHARQGHVTLKTAAKTMPRPATVIPDPIEVDLSWLLRHIDDAGRVVFGIDRAHPRCHTPRRNDAIAEALAALTALYDFCERVRRYFFGDLFPVQVDHGRDLGAIDDASVFVPVLPLFEEPRGAEGVLPAAHAEAFLAEERRSLSEKCRALAAVFPRDNSAITAVEATMLVTLAHVQSVCRAYAGGVDFIETMLRQQLIAAIGKELSPGDFNAYMDFHHRKLLAPAYRPVPFSYAIRRPEHDPEGVLTLEADHGVGGYECAPTTVAHALAERPMTFALDASTRVAFTGERHLHAWLSHQFSGQAGPSLELVARARQFSSFIVLVGRIASADVFEPRAAVIVQNKDLLKIPLLLEPLPSAREFRDAIESLSPEQQRFAKAFRAMQLESTLFGVCILQIKPQLEKLLRLPPDALTKEIRLSQEVLGLFIDHQIPSDLLSYDGPEEAPTELKLERVRTYVGRMQEMIAHSKQRQIEEEREREALRLAEMNRTAAMAPMPPPGSAGFGPPPFGPPGGAPMMPSAAAMGGAPVVSSPSRAKRAAPPPRAPMAETPMASMAAMPMESSAEPVTLAPPAPEMANAAEASAPTPSHASPAQDRAGRPAASSDGSPGAVDYTRIPAALDRQFEALDEDGAVRSTILKPGPVWRRTSQKGLLGAPSTQSLREVEQKAEKHKAFDLLDALTKSGALPIEDASLHVVVAATHRFDRTLLDTVIEANVNPIEKVERSLVLVGSTIHGRSAAELVAPDQHARFFATSPRLGPAETIAPTSGGSGT
jgi:hypothetical protein